MLVILSGTSGVGKNTIINSLLSEYSEKYLLLPTYTTREMREFEKQGEPYYFISEDQFKHKILEDDFYEHEIVHGHFYGTSRNLLLNKKKEGKILIKDIDVKGTQNLVKIAKKDIDIVTFFLYVQSKEELKKRLISRGEKDIELRLSRYDLEMRYVDKYSYLIENENKDYTVSIINSLVENEFNKVRFSPTHDASYSMIEHYIHVLQEKKPVNKFIEITQFRNQWFILSGHSLYLASLATGIHVTKKVINNYENKHIVVCKNGNDVWESFVNRLDESY